MHAAAKADGQRAVERARVSMPERVTIRRVRSPFAESTRFPGEGQSAQGQSGPKARPKGVADGQAVNIPPPAWKVEPSEDAGRDGIGVLDAPVPQGRRHSIRKSDERPATKSRCGTTRRPVPQPTQVGEASIRRRSGERS